MFSAMREEGGPRWSAFFAEPRRVYFYALGKAKIANRVIVRCSKSVKKAGRGGRPSPQSRKGVLLHCWSRSQTRPWRNGRSVDGSSVVDRRLKNFEIVDFGLTRSIARSRLLTMLPRHHCFLSAEAQGLITRCRQYARCIRRD